MRKMIIITLSLMLLVGLAEVARAYTYESDIDPTVVNTWERVERSINLVVRSVIIISKNPDPVNPIRYAIFLLVPSEQGGWAFKEYAYYKFDKLYLFRGETTSKGRHYYSVEPTPKAKKHIDEWLLPYLKPTTHSLKV